MITPPRIFGQPMTLASDDSTWVAGWGERIRIVVRWSESKKGHYAQIKLDAVPGSTTTPALLQTQVSPSAQEAADWAESTIRDAFANWMEAIHRGEGSLR